uniref:Uncharacterized protein n=1 Tax=Steinernema glaseri TaxID=37863 RepID=A0A1I7ZF98_9BILA
MADGLNSASRRVEEGSVPVHRVSMQKALGVDANPAQDGSFLGQRDLSICRSAAFLRTVIVRVREETSEALLLDRCRGCSTTVLLLFAPAHDLNSRNPPESHSTDRPEAGRLVYFDDRVNTLKMAAMRRTQTTNS